MVDEESRAYLLPTPAFKPTKWISAYIQLTSFLRTLNYASIASVFYPLLFLYEELRTALCVVHPLEDLINDGSVFDWRELGGFGICGGVCGEEVEAGEKLGSAHLAVEVARRRGGWRWFLRNSSEWRFQSNLSVQVFIFLFLFPLSNTTTTIYPTSTIPILHLLLPLRRWLPIPETVRHTHLHARVIHRPMRLAFLHWTAAATLAHLQLILIFLQLFAETIVGRYYWSLLPSEVECIKELHVMFSH